MQALLLVFFLGFLLPSVDSAVNTIGDQTVLVVAVISNIGNSSTKEEISDRVFGNPSNPPGWPDLTSIYKTCSYEKLNIIKTKDRKPINDAASPNGNSAEPIVNGATAVTLNNLSNISNSDGIVENTLKDQFNVTSLSELADHVIHCRPGNIDSSSDAPIGGGWVRMSKRQCLKSFVLAHEFGHSIGLIHSGQIGSTETIAGYPDKDEYGDESCIMGHAFAKNSFLQEKFEIGINEAQPMPVCFNGEKSWNLGWFEEQHRHTFRAANKTWEGQLIGQVDKPKSNGTKFKIILKLEDANTTRKDDYYVMFHRVTRPFTDLYNYDNANTVTIVSPKSTSGRARSELIKILKPPSANISETVFQKDNFDGPGKHLKLTVKSINFSSDPAFAEIVVEMLGQDTAVPTSATPTTQPTTGQPTTTSPTAKPTTTPTTQTTTGEPTTTSPMAKPIAEPTATPTTAKPTATPIKAGTSKAKKKKESKNGKSKAQKTKSKAGKGSIDENI